VEKVGQPKSKIALGGTWEQVGDRINYTYLWSPQLPAIAGKKDEDILIVLTAEYFEVQAKDGTRRRYDRVRQPKA
jgi:hypothetical protein